MNFNKNKINIEQPVEDEVKKLESIELCRTADLEGGEEGENKPLNDGSAPSNAAKAEMDETTKMLMAMPPDWDLAERYGQSKRVVDRAAILVAEASNSDNKCIFS